MTLSELHKWRKYVPFFVFAFCTLPWFLVRSKTLSEVKTANDLVVPVIAVILAFFYVGSDLRRKAWEAEKDAYVGKQIRGAILDMVPRDLTITETERNELEGEVFKQLTGVFWEALDRDDALRLHKEHFY